MLSVIVWLVRQGKKRHESKEHKKRTAKSKNPGFRVSVDEILVRVVGSWLSVRAV